MMFSLWELLKGHDPILFIHPVISRQGSETWLLLATLGVRAQVRIAYSVGTQGSCSCPKSSFPVC